MNIATKISFIIFFVGISLGVSAQIGINTIKPDTSAVLDIVSRDKGIKLPDIKDVSVMNPPADSSGYLIYHSTSKKFRYWNKQIWESVNPFNVDKNENVTAPKNLRVEGDSVIAIQATVKANNFVGYGTIPLGGIIMWSGDTLEIPDGWALCDGRKINMHATPDLRGRFIAGLANNPLQSKTMDGNYLTGQNNAVSSDYFKTGVPGGIGSIVLNANQLPTHNHTVIDNGHSHSITGEIMQKEGSTTQEVVAIDTQTDDKHGNVTFADKISKSVTGIQLANTGGNYTYKSYKNPARLYPADSCFEYKCSEYGIIFYSSMDLSYFSTTSSEYFDATPNSYVSDYNGYTLNARFNNNGNIKYEVDEFVSDRGSFYETMDNITCIVNPSYTYSVYVNPLYKADKALNETIIFDEKWDVLPFDNRPPYYVLAFIMRVK